MKMNIASPIRPRITAAMAMSAQIGMYQKLAVLVITSPPWPCDTLAVIVYLPNLLTFSILSVKILLEFGSTTPRGSLLFNSYA